MKMTRHFQFSSHAGVWCAIEHFYPLSVSIRYYYFFSLFYFCFFFILFSFFLLCRFAVFFFLLLLLVRLFFSCVVCTIAFWAVQVSFNIVVIGIYSSAFAIHSHWPYTECVVAILSIYWFCHCAWCMAVLFWRCWWLWLLLLLMLLYSFNLMLETLKRHRTYRLWALFWR